MDDLHVPCFFESSMKCGIWKESLHFIAFFPSAGRCFRQIRAKPGDDRGMAGKILEVRIC
jgi:hypothetical protein